MNKYCNHWTPSKENLAELIGASPETLLLFSSRFWEAGLSNANELWFKLGEIRLIAVWSGVHALLPCPHPSRLPGMTRRVDQPGPESIKAKQQRAELRAELERKLSDDAIERLDIMGELRESGEPDEMSRLATSQIFRTSFDPTTTSKLTRCWEHRESAGKLGLLPAKARTAPCGRGGWVCGRALAGPEGPKLVGGAVAVATAFTPEPVGENRAE